MREREGWRGVLTMCTCVYCHSRCFFLSSCINYALLVFVVKVWKVTGNDEEDLLCFEKMVDLQSFAYLGLTVRIGASIFS